MTITNEQIIPCAFLFTDSTPGDNKGPMLDEALLTALKLADPKKKTESRVYRGGVLLAQLSYKPAALKAEPVKRRSNGNRVIAQTSRTERSDSDLYATLVGDFVETCCEQWNTLNHKIFWDYVAKHTLDAMFLPSLSLSIAKEPLIFS